MEKTDEKVERLCRVGYEGKELCEDDVLVSGEWRSRVRNGDPYHKEQAEEVEDDTSGR